MRVANLIVPGAQRSATTSLVEILVSTDACAIGERKEPHFFSKDRKYELGLDAYAELFPQTSSARYLVDGSQSYLPLPYVPQRLRDSLGADVRFVISLRHPVDRAVSAFRHFNFHEGGDRRDSITAIIPRNIDSIDTLDALTEWEQHAVRDGLANASLRSRNDTWSKHGFPFRYFDIGRYSGQIRRFLELWDRDRFLFLRHEDVTAQGTSLGAALAEFLGIEQARFDSTLVRANASRTFRSGTPTRLRDLALGGSARLKTTRLGRAVQPTLSRVARRALLSDFDESLPSGARDHITALFRHEISQVEDLTQLDLGDWK